MCEICEWENAMPYNLDAILEKYEDALECADSWEEKNIYSEVLDDLRALKARA